MSTLTSRGRHDLIISYLKEISKTTKVFESRWQKGQLITPQILKSTPISSYIKQKWKQSEIKQLFIRAQCSMGRNFEQSVQQSFTPKYTPKLTKKRKSFRAKNKKRNKRKSESDIPLQMSKLSQLSKLYQNGSRDSDDEISNIKPLYETAHRTKMKNHSSAKTLLMQSESMSFPKPKSNANSHSKVTNGSNPNPYLDASVLAQVCSPKQSLNIPEEGMQISPLNAQKMLQQMPWQNMEQFGMTMECKVILRRDKDIERDKLQKENAELMQRIKDIEGQMKHKNDSETDIKNDSIKYNFDGFGDSVVILRSECTNKPLVNHRNKLEISQGFIGFEIYSQWRMLRCANGIYKFQQWSESIESETMFIRMLGNAGAFNENGTVDVKGNDTTHCEFRTHLVTHKNVIMLESVMFPNKYLAANGNGVYVYNCDDDMMAMNRECMFQILMIQSDAIINIRKDKTGDMFTILVDLNDSIAKVKSIISDKQTISVNKQMLYFEDTELNNNKTLSAYNIVTNDIIDLKLRNKSYNEMKESIMGDISSSDDYNDQSTEETSSSSEEYESDSLSDFEKEETKQNSALSDDSDGENEELPKLGRNTSKFRKCIDDLDVHTGAISCIVCSPTDYTVITGGEHDKSIRIWVPKRVERNDGKLLSEITFVPKRKAAVNGTVFSVTQSEDGLLIAAGCSWKKSQNGYVVVWNMKRDGSILCDLKSKELESNKLNRGRHARAMSLTLNAKSLMGSTASTKRVSASKLFQIKRTDSVSQLRFGIVHCVKLMRFKSKKRSGMNYLLFGGDTTGCVLCWNLALKNSEIPICRINAGNDVIYDLAIINNKYLFSVSHDKSMRYCNIKGLRKKKAIASDDSDTKNEKKFVAIDTMQIYKDPEYALHSIALNLTMANKIELVFGSRKCTEFEMNQLVVIRHKYGEYVCVKKTKKNKRELCGNANFDEIQSKSAKWNIEYLDKDKIRLRSRKSGKYLRFSRNGTSIDCLGNGIASDQESVFKWKANESTLESHKYPKYFMAVHKENHTIVSIKKDEIYNNENVSIEFELFESHKLESFQSFFDYIYEPPQDLDRICNLKIRKKLLIVQRKDINCVKVFNLCGNDSDGIGKNTLLKRFKIGKCDCYKSGNAKQNSHKYVVQKYNRNKAEESEDRHVFRMYDCGISFNQKYAILCVGIFTKNNLKKAVSFSLKGFKIPKTAKKPSSCSFCPK